VGGAGGGGLDRQVLPAEKRIPGARLGRSSEVMGAVSREGGRGTGAGSGLGCCLVGCGVVAGGHSLSWDFDNVEDSCSSRAFM